MHITVDRIEGECIVAELENGDMVNLPRVIAPEAKEGDVISITIDHQETGRLKDKIRSLMDSLWEDEQ